jgi:hypothetical protein
VAVRGSDEKQQELRHPFPLSEKRHLKALTFKLSNFQTCGNMMPENGFPGRTAPAIGVTL